MTTFAAPKDQLLELEDRTRHAWGLYREHLTDLDGIAYLEAERAEWEHLQTDLAQIAVERERLSRRRTDGVHDADDDEAGPPG